MQNSIFKYSLFLLLTTVIFVHVVIPHDHYSSFTGFNNEHSFIGHIFDKFSDLDQNGDHLNYFEHDEQTINQESNCLLSKKVSITIPLKVFFTKLIEISFTKQSNDHLQSILSRPPPKSN